MTQSINIRRKIFFEILYVCVKGEQPKNVCKDAVLLNVNVDFKDVRNIATSAHTCHFCCWRKYLFFF